MVANDSPGAVRPNWSLRSRRWLITGATFATILAFAAGATAYWKYVSFVPEFIPALPSTPSPNGYTEASRVGTWLPLLPDSRSVKWRTEPASQLRSFVAPILPRLLAVRRTFQLAWHAPSPLNGEARSGPNPSLFADYMCAASRLARLEGRPGEALRWSIDAMELGNAIGRGGGRSGTQSSEEAGMAQAERCVQAVPLVGLAEQLARVRRLRVTWPRATDALEIDRLEAHARLTARLQDLSHKTLSEQLNEAEPASSALSGPTRNDILHHTRQAWVNLLTPRTRSLAALDRHYELMKARARAPIRDGYGKAPLTDYWAGSFGSNEMGCYRWEWPRHNLALLEVALAVRLFYVEHGRYPASLDEIERKYLPEVPVDVWDQPLRYRLRNGRPVIYSIGRDGIDDGGRAVDPNTLVEHGTGDAVWGKLCATDWPRKR